MGKSLVCKGMLSKHCHISHGLVRMCMYIGFYYSLKKALMLLCLFLWGLSFKSAKIFI